MVNFKALRFQHLPLRQPNASLSALVRFCAEELALAGLTALAIFIVGSSALRIGLLHLTNDAQAYPADHGAEQGSAAIRAKASHNLRVSEGVDIYAPRVKWVELPPENR